MKSNRNFLPQILFAGLAVLISAGVTALEKPKYQVLFETGKIEYRLYESYLVAETTVSDTDSYGKASNQGFFRLFDYISGDNRGNTSIEMTSPVQQTKKSEKIAMTAPVQQQKGEQGWTVAFMLPHKYDLQSAPSPISSNVRIRQVPQRLMAVIRYSGRWTEKNFNRQNEKLREELENRGIDALSIPESAVYNPPFVPPFMRRNEVMIEVNRYPESENLPTQTP